ncbi:metabotropic glutamate receptor 8-like [Octopus vulgaris]|uniref:Metabotropic glutamate receptor 8-like n=1 Tax=Octopus vulgaris TaxID=6645 RepID=A0AA36ARC0_OCTVU|nr:metabotropic glutamate receptor 8-like [Octopus vulgaris]
MVTNSVLVKLSVIKRSAGLASVERSEAKNHRTTHILDDMFHCRGIDLDVQMWFLIIPQISYASTSIDLSDKTRFDYFSRVVPPDSYQAQAMVDIAKHFKWNYVSTLADEGNYGERGISAFEERAKTSGVCIARSLKIPRSVNEEKFDNLVKDLLGVANSRVVVMFVNEDNSRGILRALKKSNRTSELSFLASDSWGAKIHPVFEQESVAESAVTILPKRQKIVEFDDYFLNLRLKNNKRNVWFKEYWEAMFNCTTDEKLAYAGHKQCKGDESLDRVSYQQEGLVQFVIDSVYSLAHAVENMIKEKCNGQVKLCRASRNLPGEELLRHIRNVTFQGIADETVEFNEKGDGPGRYDVYQYQRDDIEYKYIRIGEWTGSLRLFEDKISWRNGSNVTPTSICSEPCGLGYAKSGSDACCWVCVRCNDYQILENVSTCKDCPLGFRPDANKTSCVRLPVLHLQWTTLWAILPITFSALGIVSTIFVLVTFILYSKTPVIMASGRELCYILFLGIFLSYGTSFVMLARPSIAICTIMRLGLGSSLSLVYASMLTKTNRIYRIFNRGIRAVVKRPSYTSPRSQVIICFSLVSVQVVGAFTWIGFERPDIMYVLQGKDALILKCKTSQIAIVISLFYNMFLIILCTVYAFKTRKIPQNFNEAKYIAFTMYSTCIVWLAFIPIYFGANQDFKIQITSLCMCVSISATVALACLFAPKIYIVLCQPQKNTRNANATSIHSSTCGAIAKSSRPFFAAATAHKLEPRMTTQNGSIVGLEDNKPPEMAFSDSIDDTSCDEGAAMARTPT